MSGLTSDDLGRAAYEAYGRSVNHKTVAGDDMWQWDELPIHLREAWVTAAIAVRTKLEIAHRSLVEGTWSDNWLRERETDR